MDYTPENLIREKIDAKQIVRARDIFTVHRDSIPRELQDSLAKELAKLFNKVEALHSQAIAAENQGKGEEALSFFEAVFEKMEDYPKIEINLERVRSAEALRKVVQKRMEKKNQNQETEPAKGFPIWAIVATTVLLLLAVSFLFVGNQQEPMIAKEEPNIAPAAETASRITTETPAPETDSAPAPLVKNNSIAETESSERQDPTPPAREIELQPLAISPSSGNEILPLQGPGEQPPIATALIEQPDVEEISDVVNVSPLLKNHLYTVQKGDSLSDIAYRLFCNEIAREQLYQLNRDQIDSANEIEIGMLLRLKGEGIEIENRCNNEGTNIN